MGKIYDALEKSQQFSTNKIPEPKRTPSKLDAEAQIETPAATTPMRLDPMGKGLDRRLISYFEPESIVAEQFRKLATNIIFQTSPDKARCLLLTSANEGEGKSFLTANLAVTLSKSLEEPVLLLDCDLRRPRLHQMFGFSNVPGLSEHLIKEMDISSLIQKTAVDNLNLLPAGTRSFRSAELLSSKRFPALLETLKNRHKEQFILIDSPPLLGTAEPMAIARQVDGIILVIKCEDTPRKMVEDLVETIGKDKILGVVLNRFSQRTKPYYRYGT